MKTAIIVNPFSGGGRTARMWAERRDEVRTRLGSLQEYTTKGMNDGTRLATEVSHTDADLLIVAGGDGTINEVVNGLFTEENKLINPNLKLGILSAGRGCDFIRSVNVPSDAREAVDVLVNPQIQKVDVGLCFFKDEFGRDKKRFFVNIASAGVAGRVARQVSHTPRFLPPGIAYFAAVVSNFVTYRPQLMKVTIDEKEVFDGPCVNVFVANGRYSGAGMCWAPTARVDDGLFEIVIGEPTPKLTTILQQHKIYDGSFLELPGIHHHQGKKVVIETLADVLLEIDGEQPGLAPALYTILPKALNLAVGL